MQIAMCNWNRQTSADDDEARNGKALRSHRGLLIVIRRTLAYFILGDEIFNVYDQKVSHYRRWASEAYWAQLTGRESLFSRMYADFQAPRWQGEPLKASRNGRNAQSYADSLGAGDKEFGRVFGWGTARLELLSLHRLGVRHVW
jgi:hypothetical protein